MYGHPHSVSAAGIHLDNIKRKERNRALVLVVVAATAWLSVGFVWGLSWSL